MQVIEVRHPDRMTRMRVSANAEECGGTVPARGDVVELVGEYAPAAVRGRPWRVARVTQDRYVYGFYDVWLEPHLVDKGSTVVLD